MSEKTYTQNEVNKLVKTKIAEAVEAYRVSTYHALVELLKTNNGKCNNKDWLIQCINIGLYKDKAKIPEGMKNNSCVNNVYTLASVNSIKENPLKDITNAAAETTKIEKKLNDLDNKISKFLSNVSRLEDSHYPNPTSLSSIPNYINAVMNSQTYRLQQPQQSQQIFQPVMNPNLGNYAYPSCPNIVSTTMPLNSYSDDAYTGQQLPLALFLDSPIYKQCTDTDIIKNENSYLLPEKYRFVNGFQMGNGIVFSKSPLDDEINELIDENKKYTKLLYKFSSEDLRISSYRAIIETNKKFIDKLELDKYNPDCYNLKSEKIFPIIPVAKFTINQFELYFSNHADEDKYGKLTIYIKIGDLKINLVSLLSIKFNYLFNTSYVKSLVDNLFYKMKQTDKAIICTILFDNSKYKLSVSVIDSLNRIIIETNNNTYCIDGCCKYNNGNINVSLLGHGVTSDLNDKIVYDANEKIISER